MVYGIVLPALYKQLLGGLEHLDDFSIQLGISSSQLTNSIIFQRGRYTTNQYFFPLKSIGFPGLVSGVFSPG